jgi:hypothetical protein
MYLSALKSSGRSAVSLLIWKPNSPQKLQILQFRQWICVKMIHMIFQKKKWASKWDISVDPWIKFEESSAGFSVQRRFVLKQV